MSNALRPTPSTGAPTTATDDDWKATALIFRGQRQALIASNIANADTPKYQARDISFSAALEEASRVRPAAQPAPIATTAPGHLAPTLVAPRNTLQFAEYALPSQTSLDGNTVDIDRERASFAQNSILHQLAVASLDDELKEFKMAIADPRRA
ncbi:flagellar basal body rod protein FlgB [Pelomonas aquatica]|jgi:flagellar basal-body rod protein FlgB|uniref:Flagellar basal body rod protein FlgB n=1 Tax=Pelomonas aquatica TaxID=431058 RepID=A0A9X4R3Y8_9BURK|nr:flagellar basal body rod protein FlgB [Pelomonas aquatica]MCY4754397.1 flagellar basal body rod protein FlgB [Pelomonas aquatica]MDG0861554.1 flagellar basal body rod protein FlgB [Pelomonas aquatica]